ncbi:hypothetical protein TRICI_002814 [Trichomonascus ciferrii]|uniref:Uncharacterized protein n=1 Tax=Trichomonascus ciferrii TaxID=44093 RepID=A0A642V5L0_9ASCO|nr:hypothetical protein TRICI_002814 [Trichomonascus ciferrii]
MATATTTDRVLKTPQSVARCRVGKKRCSKTGGHSHSIDPSSTLLSPPPSRHHTTASLQHFTDDFLATPSKSYGSLQAAFQEQRGQRDATPALKLRRNRRRRRQALSLITINGRAQVSAGLGLGTADSDSSDDDDEDDYYYTPDDACLALKQAVANKNNTTTTNMQPEDPAYLYDPPQTPPRNVTYDYQHVAATTPSKFVTDATLFSAYTVIGMSPYGF